MDFLAPDKRIGTTDLQQLMELLQAAGSGQKELDEFGGVDPGIWHNRASPAINNSYDPRQLPMENGRIWQDNMGAPKMNFLEWLMKTIQGRFQNGMGGFNSDPRTDPSLPDSILNQWLYQNMNRPQRPRHYG